MAKEITDLVEATVLNNADLILARQGSEDKKALISTLIDKINLGLPVADSANKGIVDKELILQLLLLVDGSGSGLDADLLDGEEGAFYQNADNLNAGTVPVNRLPSSTTTQKGVVQKATTLEAETGVVDKFPDAAGVLSAITANAKDLLNTIRIDVASATTVDLTANAPDTRHINITGSNSISAFTVEAGQCYFVRFDAAPTLVNSASLVTQRGVNITTVAGATCLIRATASNVVEVMLYTESTPGRSVGDQMVILPNGSYTSGTYTIPSGYVWTDFDRVEMITLISSASPSEFNTTSLVTADQIAVSPTGFKMIAGQDLSEDARLSATSLTQFSISTFGNNAVASVIAYLKPGVV